MDNKITAAALSAALSQATGKNKKLCDDFIKEFFRTVAESLEAGEPLRIKGFGSFKVVEVESRTGVNIQTGRKQEIEAHRKVVFTPAKELASMINAPFEDFETVEIDEEFPEDIFYGPLSEIGSSESGEETEEISERASLEGTDENSGNENLVSDERLEQGSNEEGEDDEITAQAYETLQQEPEIPVAAAAEPAKEAKGATQPATEAPIEEQTAESIEGSAEEPVEEVTEQPIEEPAPSYPLPVHYEGPQPRSRFGSGFLVGALSAFTVCVVIFMLGCFFDWWPVNFGNPKDALTAAQSPEIGIADPALTDTIEEVAIPEEEPVYDTVSTTRYLTTISRDHYGDYNFWPYIYIENEKILGHPDRITPGTKVVVPSLEKYGVNPSNKDDVKEAKKKGVEIYARFR